MLGLFQSEIYLEQKNQRPLEVTQVNLFHLPQRRRNEDNKQSELALPNIIDGILTNREAYIVF